MPTPTHVRRRGALLAAAVAAAALVAGCGEVHAQLTLGPVRAVTVALDAPPSASYAALYMANVHGDYAKGAIAARIVEAPGGDSLGMLASGRATFAVASEPALLEARAHGEQLVAIAALTREPLDGIVSLARRPVTTAAALAGHVAGVAPTPLAGAELATALTAAGVAPARVRRVAAAPANALALLRGRYVLATLTAPWPVEWAQLALSRPPPAAPLALPAVGVPVYSGLVLVVRVGEAHFRGPLLRAFLESLTRGQHAAMANPTAAAVALVDANAAIAPGVERTALTQTEPRAAPLDSTKPFGYQDPRAWLRFATWMARHGLLPAAAAANAELAVTDEFLPGQGPQPG